MIPTPKRSIITNKSLKHARHVLNCCRIVGGIKNKNIKKQPWSKVECFAFGGATVRFASLETSFHAANHTITPPPSYEGLPRWSKDKNRSPFHGEKPLMITWFLGKKPHQISQTILHGRDAILRVRDKWLIFNMVSLLWADVKYHVPTRLVFCFCAPRIYPLNLCMGEFGGKEKKLT